MIFFQASPSLVQVVLQGEQDAASREANQAMNAVVRIQEVKALVLLLPRVWLGTRKAEIGGVVVRQCH